MKKKYYKYKIYVDNKPVAMVQGSKDYTLKEIGQYFSKYLTTIFNEIRIIREENNEKC